MHSKSRSTSYAPHSIYDSQRRLTQIASPQGILNYGYNDLNQTTRVWTSKTTAATDAITDTLYTYDTYSRLKSVTAIERADELVANSGDTTTYHYDGVGNLDAQVVENGTSAVTTDYQYDALNRLVYMVHFDDLNADLAYDDQTETLFASFAYTLGSRGNRVASSDVIDDGSTVHTYDFTWVYDDLNRLISEELDAGNSALDYTDTYTYDLAGNRLSRTRDKGSDSSIEETTTYTYDANDRLLTETLDSTENGGTADDRFTAYAHDNTNQTGKTVREGLDNTGTIRSQTSMTYNEMGRLASTTVTTYDTLGSQLSETVAEYGYNDTGLRITETTTTDGGTPEVKSFLFDTRNPTGFAQVLEEYIDGVLKQVFTLGHDVIAQTDVTDPQDQDVYTLLSDGHGSTRALLNAVSTITQQYAYDAYGNMLASTGLTTAATAISRHLYSGEWTSSSGQQYLRARFYDPASGTFNRLDPFAGNLNDPQSLHKYLYVHGNPVMFVDSSGRNRGLQAVALGDLAANLVEYGYNSEQAHAALRTGDTQAAFGHFMGILSNLFGIVTAAVALSDINSGGSGPVFAGNIGGAFHGAKASANAINLVGQSTVAVMMGLLFAMSSSTPSGFRGGRHGDTKGPVGDGLDSNHSPADAVSPFRRNDGPAFQMDPRDHQRMTSTGRSREAIAWRKAQQDLIDQGRLRDAVQMDIDEARRLFLDKYDQAINEMLDYITSIGY